MPQLYNILLALAVAQSAIACDTDANESRPPATSPQSEVAIGPRDYFVLPANGVQVFPSYLAHLLGKTVGGIPLHFVQPIAVTNKASQSRLLTVRLSVPGYAQPGSATVTVAPLSSATVDVQPQLDLHALYAISAPTAVQVNITVEEAGTQVASATDRIQIAPRNTVFWAYDRDGKLVDLRALVASFVMPNDPEDAVQSLLTEAARKHPLGSMLGYQYEGRTRQETVGPFAKGEWLNSYPMYRTGQAISIAAQLRSCQNCEYLPQILLLTPSQCENWLYVGTLESIAGANIKEEGAQLSVTAPETGYYCYVVRLPGQGSAQINITRTWGLDEGARTELAAIFDALHARGLVYVNVPGTFFDGAQNVKLPSQSLRTGSSNCIDGSLLFASALEALGMDPVLVIVPGHAFIGVAPFRGSSAVEVIETTMVSAGNASDAFESARSTLDDASESPITEPWVMPAFIRISAVREFGITPMPF